MNGGVNRNGLTHFAFDGRGIVIFPQIVRALDQNILADYSYLNKN